MATNEKQLREQMDELRAQLDQIEHTKRLADSTIRLGRMYRYRNSYSCPQSEDDYWWTYRKVLSVDDDGYCRCLEFHIDRDGKASIHMETAFRFYAGWQEIPANVFERALTEFRRKVGDLIESV